jgi:ABC-type glycerol-3-phosphate transport system substrate-binding protein
MVFGASFVGAQGDLPGNEDVWVSGFPRASGSQPVVVGGDVAVVPQQPEPDASTEAAHDFVEWLVTSEAMTEWGRHDRGFLAPNLESPIRQSEEPEDDVRRVLTSQLVDEDPLLLPDGPRPFLFDLSDNQLTIRDGDDQHRVWRDFTRFFRKVTAGPRTAEQGAIAELMGGLERYYEQSRQLDESQCPA